MDRDQQLDEIITAYLKAVESGAAVNQADWLERYPDFAEELAEFFAGQRSVERVAAPLRELEPRGGAAGPAVPQGQAPRPAWSEAPTVGTDTNPTEAAVPQPGDKVRYFGDYELLDKIAQGGMGVVYKARQVSLNRVVALKMILAGQLASDADVNRFQTEAEAAANLDHPNIVPIYEIGAHLGQHYFSMKLIDGASLAQRAAQFAGDPKAAVKLLAKIARAVHDAHQHGILHRDLKPSNILIDARGEPFVGDFGLAKRVDGRSPQTRTGLILGTPSYMAPEQARSEKALTTAVDVYGLGAILYELLTGRPPFRAETELETILQVLERDPPSPRSVNPRIDRDLETICLKCLEKSPASRYGSALALAEDLERWSAGHPIQARPSGPLKRAWKWTKRNPALAVLLVVLPLWYFNVRLPWEWAWLEWSLFALYVALALWRIGTLWRGAGGGLGRRWDFSWDDIYLPGVLLAPVVLAFYPAELADRKALTLALIVIPFLWKWVIACLWRRAHAGPLLLAIRFPLPIVILFGLSLGIMATDEVINLFYVPESGDFLAHVAARLQTLSVYCYAFLPAIIGLELREQGCLTFLRFARWEEIESYEWKLLGANHLTLILKLRNNPVSLRKMVSRTKKASVDQVLREHVPESGSALGALDEHVSESGSTLRDLDEPSQGFAPGERDPAERVRDVALLLIVSGAMQIVGSIPFLIASAASLVVQPGAQKSWETLSMPVLLLFLGLASLLVGVMVVVGAVKMRNLSDYRAARRTSILAMLPLGFGVLLGLPFGIWSLLMLKRPDVRAAFGVRDGRS